MAIKSHFINILNSVCSLKQHCKKDKYFTKLIVCIKVQRTYKEHNPAEIMIYMCHLKYRA